ncbi:MerR family transcriptional regulator [Listeria fleischmannii]|uniref:MerR family transcriptional regulator n=1 Tax=Listeria fleischmannii TaxID=1069827 RepID=A0A841YGY2_9LIST|nr:MerR family transcriptional regulator [Listeria fleischmannii]EIA19229.1 HTH-type transcriptional regulator skgA [Listeria fleischmannii subsp. coloradonensis]MBC1399483.1 MerR family transcriptional regulator [Listeria fleischmannii]MBC1427788.1 MerR family transcriptional regulator [Listeria fleischmannii]STY46688.1 Multidrug transporter activation protein [Listeria fleischmannii subsp. coloradonensis]
MEYTIQKVAKLAGVSARTLRYYDEIGLLKPARLTSSGYRIYGQAELDLLQQILFYREMDLALPEIKSLVADPHFQPKEALKSHHKELLRKKERLDVLIRNVENTLSSMEGMKKMTDKEKFEGFKKELVDENERKYGTEIRAKYGDKKIDESNAKMMKLSEEDFAKMEALNDTLFELLERAKTEDHLQAEIYEAHKKWLSYSWPSYSKEAHAGLVNMYVDDSRFTAYYDERGGEGTARRLRDAVIASI